MGVYPPSSPVELHLENIEQKFVDLETSVPEWFGYVYAGIGFICFCHALSLWYGEKQQNILSALEREISNGSKGAGLVRQSSSSTGSMPLPY